MIDVRHRNDPSHDLFHSEQLLARMNKLRKAEQLCDVTLKVEQTLFPAHRLVLAAASDYFSAMFTAEVISSLIKRILCFFFSILNRWQNEI